MCVYLLEIVAYVVIFIEEIQNKINRKQQVWEIYFEILPW